MLLLPEHGPVAYFSMEVGLESHMPTYAGGLGVLAGDTLRAAADLGVPLIGMTLLHRQGYFRQQFDVQGAQIEAGVQWSPEEFLQPLDARVTVTIENRPVVLRAWKRELRGVFANVVPVYFLDARLDENSLWDQTLTDFLYGGDERYRLCQEVVLGLGGVAMLEALGHTDIETFHMNEGHSALLVLGLVDESFSGDPIREITEPIHESVRQRCVFTTHTPIPAGHDQFPLELVRSVLGEDVTQALVRAGCCWNNSLNMTYLALRFSRYINGVAQRHSEVARGMYPDYAINSITNGVHATTWTSIPFQQLYDRHIPQWRRDNHYLRYVISVPLHEIQAAHAEAKRTLLAEVEKRTGISLRSDVLTIGFARRAAVYKRADLLFTDHDRLLRIASETAPLQLIYAGKAHPRDEAGKQMIRRIFEIAARYGERLRVVYLSDYDMALAAQICAGVDVWLNTPQKPQEASGTSGMKAALNGVPSFSVLDGWWIEGHIEGVTGWSIDQDPQARADSAQEARSLYEKLEHVILPMFYHRPDEFAEVMRSAMALNGSYFNTQRMVSQYVRNAYVNHMS